LVAERLERLDRRECSRPNTLVSAIDVSWHAASMMVSSARDSGLEAVGVWVRVLAALLSGIASTGDLDANGVSSRLGDAEACGKGPLTDGLRVSERGESMASKGCMSRWPA
jgi:hypothetical protein